MFPLLSSTQWTWIVIKLKKYFKRGFWLHMIWQTKVVQKSSLTWKRTVWTFFKMSPFCLLRKKRRNVIRVSKNMSELFLRELPSLFIFMFKAEVMVSREELIEGTVTCVFNCTSYQTAELICTTGTAFCTYCSINLNTCFWDGAFLRQVVSLKRELLSFESCFRAYSMSHCVGMWISE